MKAERHAWILEWLKVGFSADALNAKFHDDYLAKFPGFKRRETFWGAAPVHQANADLRDMHKAGLLERRRIGLKGNWQPGFPKWVWSYCLPAKK